MFLHNISYALFSIGVRGDGTTTGFTNGSFSGGLANGYCQTKNYGGFGCASGFAGKPLATGVGSNAFFQNNSTYQTFGLAPNSSQAHVVTDPYTISLPVSMPANLFIRF